MTNATIDFRNFYAFDQWKAYVQSYVAYREHRQEETPEQEVRVTSWLDGKSELQQSLLSFLKAKASAGELEPVPFSRDREMRWPDAWNRMVDGAKPDHWDDHTLVDGMGMSITHGPTFFDRSPEASITEIEASYEDLVKNVNNGEEIRPDSAYYNCNLTGQTYHMRMGPGWRPALGQYKKGEFIELKEEVPALEMMHYTITAPSGELLVADWFRIDAFNEAIEKDDLPSVETVAGQHANTGHYARHGLISFFVSNTSPNLIEREGHFVVANGTYNDDLGDVVDPAGKNHGPVCTDRWWVTMIDRETLIGIVARTVGREVAEKQVAQHLEENDVKTVRVPPGATMHLYILDEDGLQGRFQCDAVDDRDTDPLYGVVSLAPLQWEPVSENKASPRP